MLHWWQRQKEKREAEKEKAKKCRPRGVFMGYNPTGSPDDPLPPPPENLMPEARYPKKESRTPRL